MLRALALAAVLLSAAPALADDETTPPFDPQCLEQAADALRVDEGFIMDAWLRERGDVGRCVGRGEDECGPFNVSLKAWARPLARLTGARRSAVARALREDACFNLFAATWIERRAAAKRESPAHPSLDAAQGWLLRDADEAMAAAMRDRFGLR